MLRVILEFLFCYIIETLLVLIKASEKKKLFSVKEEISYFHQSKWCRSY